MESAKKMMISRKKKQKKNLGDKQKQRGEKVWRTRGKISSQRVNFVAFLFVSFNRIESPREGKKERKKHCRRRRWEKTRQFINNECKLSSPTKQIFDSLLHHPHSHASGVCVPSSFFRTYIFYSRQHKSKLKHDGKKSLKDSNTRVERKWKRRMENEGNAAESIKGKKLLAFALFKLFKC